MNQTHNTGHTCPKCGKIARVQSQFPLGNLVNYVYQCGHLEIRAKLNLVSDNGNGNHKVEIKEEPKSELKDHSLKQPKDYPKAKDIDGWLNYMGLKPEVIHPSFFSVDGKKCAYPFQRKGIRFAEDTRLNCLIADSMGLGKTIQALISLKRNALVAFPALILVKGATTFQWAHEFTEWVDGDFSSMMPVVTRNHLIPGFKCYILSMDMLSRKGVLELLLKLNLKTIVIDECQSFKDSSAARTKALLNLIELGNIQYKLALSGTPIKNRVGEYFTILNILAPKIFDDEGYFKKRWLIPNEKGILTRLNPIYADEFKRLISNWVIRREKTDVLFNLPPLTRDYQIVEIDDPNIKNSYNRVIGLFRSFLKDNKSGIKSQHLLGWLTQLRALTGQYKCKIGIEWTRDFLESTDDSLAIGIQHHSVRDTMHIVLNQAGLNPLKLSGEDNQYKKAEIVRNFNSGRNRLLVINMIAGGVGLNLQSCANALVLEREWNSADEEQFESRFHRDGQKKAVAITYLIAKGTIDEFFHNMIQDKRNILSHTGIGFSEGDETNLESLLAFSELVASKTI